LFLFSCIFFPGSMQEKAILRYRAHQAGTVIIAEIASASV
jgi:hypothetical protein